SLSSIAIPIVGAGLPIFFIGKNRTKSLGEALIGFGLLFLGLGLLKDAVPDVDVVKDQAAHFQGFIENLGGHGYLSYVVFLVLGVVLTLVVQSSSAAMAITVTFAINGWIGFEESAFIVLGENIGTTVTAWLAALGANQNAKRAARAHFLFNVLGVGWMFLVFPLFSQGVEALAVALPESLRTANHSSDIGFKLAIFHTSFNFCNICFLIGFVPWIAKIVSKWVKDIPEDPSARRRLTFMRQNLVQTGELNLPEAEKATVELARLTQEMFKGFIEVFNHPNEDLSKKVSDLRAMEDEADETTEEITEYLVRCSAAEIGQQNATEVSQMIRIVAELETITDTIYHLVKYAQRRYKMDRELVPEAMKDTRDFAMLVEKFINFYNDQMFQPIDASILKEASTLEDQIDKCYRRLNRSSMSRLSQENADPKTEILNIEINNHLEKIGNYSLNVMESLYQMSRNEQHPEVIAAEVNKMSKNIDPSSK
ncbi:MAG: Na/Pi symporter, partial [Verrucomicrobiae bacterium]|nr:Na/Pi symporter [Verrucomicrobiae bacterium]